MWSALAKRGSFCDLDLSPSLRNLELFKVTLEVSL